MLIWICIVGSILCYFLVGWHVFRMRNRLRSFSTSRNRDKDKEMDAVRLSYLSNTRELIKLTLLNYRARQKMALTALLLPKFK